MSRHERFPSVLAAARAGAEWAWASIYGPRSRRARLHAGSGAPEPEDITGEVFVGVVRGPAPLRGRRGRVSNVGVHHRHHRLLDSRRRSRRRPVEPAPDEAIERWGPVGDVVERSTRSWRPPGCGRYSPPLARSAQCAPPAHPRRADRRAGSAGDRQAGRRGEGPATARAGQAQTRAREGGRTPMSGNGAYPDELRRLSSISDQDVERILMGKAPEGDPDLTSLVRDVEALGGDGPDAPIAERHLAAMVEAARLGNEPERPTRRKKIVSDRLLSPKWARVAAVAAATVLATSGLAVASVLPDPMQSAVASAADQVGISVDDPNAEEPDGHNNDVGDPGLPARTQEWDRPRRRERERSRRRAGQRLRRADCRGADDPRCRGRWPAGSVRRAGPVGRARRGQPVRRAGPVGRIRAVRRVRSVRPAVPGLRRFRRRAADALHRRVQRSVRGVGQLRSVGPVGRRLGAAKVRLVQQGAQALQRRACPFLVRVFS